MFQAPLPHQVPEAAPSDTGETSNRRVRTEPIQRSEVLGPLNILADETRLRILELLAAHDDLSIQELTTQLDLGRSIVAQHLRQLVKKRFIAEERESKTLKRYRLHRNRIDEVAQTLAKLLSAENARMVLNDARAKLAPALHPYLDRHGAIISWPTQKKEHIVLEYLITKFKPGESYHEKKVNERIADWHTCQDTFYVRRRLIDFGLLARTPNGSCYWRVQPAHLSCNISNGQNIETGPAAQ